MFIEDLSPSRILREAIKAVPALRFALAAVGIVAAVVMAIGISKDMRIALFGAMAAIIIMVITVLFARIASAGSRKPQAAEVAIVWFCILVFSSTIVLTFLSIFFGWPVELRPVLTGYDPRGTISSPPPSVCIGDGNCPDVNAAIYPCGYDPSNLPRYYSGCEGYASQYGTTYTPMHILVSFSKGGTCGTAYYNLTCVRADLANSQKNSAVFSPGASPTQVGQP